MDLGRKKHQTKAEPKPSTESDRNVSTRIRHDLLRLEAQIDLATGHPSVYTKRNRFAVALLKQGSVEAAIDRFNAAIAISDEQVDAQFLMACELIDRGRPSEGVRALRRASRIRLHKAIMRYALESTYYDHSIIELAMDEWRVSLGLRGGAGAIPFTKDRAGGEVRPAPGAYGGQGLAGPNGSSGVDRGMGQ